MDKETKITILNEMFNLKIENEIIIAKCSIFKENL